MIKIAFRIGEPEDFIDRVIKFLTGGNCYHCELIFSDNTAFGSSPKDKGTRFTTIENLEDDTKWKCIELPWITRKQESIIKDFCYTETGCEYDWIAILIGWIITPTASNNKWFCTEIALAAIKPFIVSIPDRWYTPPQLMQAIETEVFWQHKLLTMQDVFAEPMFP